MTEPAGSAVPLSTLSSGQSARVVFIEGGVGFRRKMTDMGIIPGKSITMAQGWGRGPRVVVVEDTRVMLGHGMLHKILVSPEGS
ncbi:MAG: FeoA family protein [Spirochaetota bacterium]